MEPDKHRSKFVSARGGSEAPTCCRSVVQKLVSLGVCFCVLEFVVTLHAQPAESAFGRREGGTTSLIGIFYDLKQNQQRQPVPNAAENYSNAIDEFLVAGFDEALFNRYFRAALPLYTTQFAINNMSADVAPKAFGVEGVVKPQLWVVHYKGQVAPPVSGTYRFVGNFDDMLVVAINRKVVLVGNRPDTRFPKLGWKEPAEAAGLPRPAANQFSKYGNWIELEADQPVDIDILIGERPGGDFYGVILVEKKGEIYGNNGEGRPILPLLQVAPNPMRDNRFITDRPTWTCFR